MTPDKFLNKEYDEAMSRLGSGNSIVHKLQEPTSKLLNEVLNRSEASKAVLTVVLTSLVYKIIHPSQDIRNHQASINGCGYSGRSFDSKHITPFLKKNRFPAMAASGWLTRSLEQKRPYNEEYSGAIKPHEFKSVFLEIINVIEHQEDDLQECLSYILQGLIKQRNLQSIDLARPVGLPISAIISLLERHFNASYSADGASRLPVLAIYAAYKCLITEALRFDGKTLLDLESHTSADSRSGRIGDVDIVDDAGKPFEAVEVKFGTPISTQLVADAFSKFKSTQVTRYYLLSTANLKDGEEKQIEEEIERIRNIHGCHVVANGVIHTLKYYLRLLSDTSTFIEHYVTLIETDKALKFEHRKKWNDVM